MSISAVSLYRIRLSRSLRNVLLQPPHLRFLESQAAEVIHYYGFSNKIFGLTFCSTVKISQLKHSFDCDVSGTLVTAHCDESCKN